jgi:uncharacterized protein involved in exopolysaccharide biosynthesis
MPIEQGEPTFDETAKAAFPEQPKAEEREVSLLDLLVVLAKRKHVILWATIAVALLALVISLLIPSRYTATTTLLPPQQQQSLASSLASQLGGVAVLGALSSKDTSLGVKNPSDLYIGMLKSRNVEDALIQRFGLIDVYNKKRMSDARKRLESRSEIESTKGGLITVSVQDKDQKRSAAIANGYVEELRRLNSTLAVTEAGQRRLFFEEQLRKAKDDLADAEVALKQTEEKTGVIHIETQAKAMISSVASMRAQIAAREVQLRATRSFATDRNPDVVLLKEQIAGLRVQLAELEKRQNDSGVGSTQVPTGQLPESGLEYVRRLRDVKYAETIFELLAKQYESAKLDEAREGAVIQIVDRAVEPDTSSFPPYKLIVLISAIAGLVLSVLWAFCAEAFSIARQDPAQREQMSTLSQLLKGRWSIL